MVGCVRTPRNKPMVTTWNQTTSRVESTAIKEEKEKQFRRDFPLCLEKKQREKKQRVQKYSYPPQNSTLFFYFFLWGITKVVTQAASFFPPLQFISRKKVFNDPGGLLITSSDTKCRQRTLSESCCVFLNIKNVISRSSWAAWKGREEGEQRHQQRETSGEKNYQCYD